MCLGRSVASLRIYIEQNIQYPKMVMISKEISHNDPATHFKNLEIYVCGVS